jgi:hypothetical protein
VFVTEGVTEFKPEQVSDGTVFESSQREVTGFKPEQVRDLLSCVCTGLSWGNNYIITA